MDGQLSYKEAMSHSTIDEISPVTDNPYNHSIDFQWYTNTLIAISNYRDDIVHNRKLPLIRMDELKDISLGPSIRHCEPGGSRQPKDRDRSVRGTLTS